MSKSGSERRAHPRVETNFQLHGSPEQGGAVARMVANNLSLGGLRCTSSADFPEMTRLAVRLLLPVRNGGTIETETVDIEAVVVRREPAESATSEQPRFELSLFFTRVDDDARLRLQSFIAMNKGIVASSTPASP